MADLARQTYDGLRHYRAVVPQQGRVVLEADTNEARQIVAEDTRQHLLDLIGPSGVPRDPLSGKRGSSYHIHALNADTADFRVGVGSIYLGGMSMRQDDATLSYGAQSEWLDGPDPPLAPIQGSMPAKELVYLRVREHEVSSAEDPTLIEPALGGPDTAQRVRLVRQVG